MAEIDDTELQQLREKAEAADSAAAAHQAAAAEADTLRSQLSEGVTKYRELATTTLPGVPADVITGDTFADVDASVTRARTIADAVRSTAAPTPAAPVVPPGGAAPRNDAPDTTGMSPHQKIRAGLEQRARTR